MILSKSDNLAMTIFLRELKIKANFVKVQPLRHEGTKKEYEALFSRAIQPRIEISI